MFYNERSFNQYDIDLGLHPVSASKSLNFS